MAMAATSATSATSATYLSLSTHHQTLNIIHKLHITGPTSKPPRLPTRLHVSSSKPITGAAAPKKNEETIFFDGGAHYGDLVANLILGFTLVWLPLTLAAVYRAFSLRYRFTNLRVTVISGEERSDFSYDVITDVQVVPRLIGEWGDLIITLKDGTKVDLRSVPKFREIAKYCLAMADQETGTKAF